MWFLSQHHRNSGKGWRVPQHSGVPRGAKHWVFQGPECPCNVAHPSPSEPSVAMRVKLRHLCHFALAAVNSSEAEGERLLYRGIQEPENIVAGPPLGMPLPLQSNP